jgi:hypothetical protein
MKTPGLGHDAREGHEASALAIVFFVFIEANIFVSSSPAFSSCVLATSFTKQNAP